MKIFNTWEVSLKILAKRESHEICARGKKVPRGLFLQSQTTGLQLWLAFDDSRYDDGVRIVSQ